MAVANRRKGGLVVPNEVNVIIDEDFILNEWVPALRSGKYRQGRSMLRSQANTYCCLGVAADLLNNEAWGVMNGRSAYRWKLTEDPKNPLYSMNDGAFLPQALLSQFTQDVLVGLNDNNNATFDDIATILEQAVVEHEINLVAPAPTDIAMFRELVRQYKDNVLDAR